MLWLLHKKCRMLICTTALRSDERPPRTHALTPIAVVGMSGTGQTRRSLGVGVTEEKATWEPCPFCGSPMNDDDGNSWPYCVNPSCDGEDYEW